jgi:hypothetical protein
MSYSPIYIWTIIIQMITYWYQVKYWILYKILNNMSDSLLSRITNNGRERPFSFGIGV